MKDYVLHFYFYLPGVFLIKKFSTSHFIYLPLQQKSHPQTQAASKLELGINQPETRQDVIGQLPEAPFSLVVTQRINFERVVILSLESKEFIRWLCNNQVIIMVKLLPITTSWKDPKEHFRKKTYCLFELVGKCDATHGQVIETWLFGKFLGKSCGIQENSRILMKHTTIMGWEQVFVLN